MSRIKPGPHIAFLLWREEQDEPSTFYEINRGFPVVFTDELRYIGDGVALKRALGQRGSRCNVWREPTNILFVRKKNQRSDED